MNINIEQLRQDLLDYYGTAMNNGFPMAIIELSKIEKASAEELIEIAQQNGINIENYIEEIER